jgi:hypothetical protein
VFGSLLVLLTKFVFHTEEMKQLLIYNGITVLDLNFNLAVFERAEKFVLKCFPFPGNLLLFASLCAACWSGWLWRSEF